ncbi:MAG: fused acetyl/propionyl-CoA carboxylase subunit alpha/methylmalonyl-CoA decarboxylase subunit alpha, partial [Deltaproteobacteria bacterium]|nr:fused acetyl/propionyl-CoA carboxylase subunit alpha/methylmalonyl-CoA decarboxylase subunit alpha [Deltaproteobacteria bacterium]
MSTGSPTSTPRAFSRVGVVNRGEPAVRFLRALRDYNRERGTSIEGVALYTDPDRGAPFLRLSDRAVGIGPALVPAVGKSGLISAYTDHARILDALERAGCDAVWPGWGFVSEDASFVEALEARGIAFIGPPSAAMRRLGDKIAAKLVASESDVPMAPWHLIADDEPLDATLAAGHRIGFPLVVKASAGGGGRGIRVVTDPALLAPSIIAVRDEAARSFGKGGLFMEACVTAARHIEVQLVVGADGV